MRKFIFNVFLFAIVVLVSVYVVLSRVDGFSDPFYLKFTTPVQSNLILGTSKSAQGIIPYNIDENLDIKIYNYSFTIGSSPYGPKYLESIKRKLSCNSSKGIFIVTVDCWSISSKCDNPNDVNFFRENNSFLGQMTVVDEKPNFQYLYNYMFGNFYRVIHKSPVALLHENGWFEVSLNMDLLSVNRRTKSNLLNYEKYLKIYKFSKVRFEYLVKTIEYLNSYGGVYLVRLPISPGLMEIENSLMPDFNSKINKILIHTEGYLDLTTNNNLFDYTDGVHLYKESGKQVSDEISKWIMNIEKDSKDIKK